MDDEGMREKIGHWKEESGAPAPEFNMIEEVKVFPVVMGADACFLTALVKVPLMKNHFPLRKGEQLYFEVDARKGAAAGSKRKAETWKTQEARSAAAVAAATKKLKETAKPKAKASSSGARSSGPIVV